jgi:peptidyl-tRNA hydrolase
MSSNAEQHFIKVGLSGDKLINITAASEYLNVSRNTTWRVIKRYKIMTFENPLDMRETLVCKDDLDRIKTILRPKENRPRTSER